jgi:hypothetical protein
VLAVDVAPFSQAVSGAEVIGTYFNEGPSLVELEIISKDGRERAVIPITPGRIDRAVITEGETRLYLPAEQRSDRRLLSTITTPTPKSAPEFLDHPTRMFYFRIIGKKITLVKPQDLTADERKRLTAAIRELQRAGR